MKNNEKELINFFLTKAKAGNMDAKNKLYNLLYTRIFNYCNSILKDYHYSQEATNEVFKKVFIKIECIDCLVSYLYITSRNVSINVLKKNNKRRSMEIEYNGFINRNNDTEIVAFVADKKANNPRKIAIIKEKIQAVDQFCANLSGINRKIYELHKEGWTTKEMAEKLSVNYSNLRVRMTRLKQRIQQFNNDAD